MQREERYNRLRVVVTIGEEKMKEVKTTVTVKHASSVTCANIQRELAKQMAQLDDGSTWQGHQYPGISIPLDGTMLTNVKFIEMVDWSSMEHDNDDATDLIIEYVQYDDEA